MQATWFLSEFADVVAAVVVRMMEENKREMKTPFTANVRQRFVHIV
eukprot:COSAG02_NODE_22838_length_739_cov_0.792188_1_plen_46_part_00